VSAGAAYCPLPADAVARVEALWSDESLTVAEVLRRSGVTRGQLERERRPGGALAGLPRRESCRPTFEATDEQVATIEREWAAGATMSAVAAAAGMPPWRVEQLRVIGRVNCPRRQQGLGGGKYSRSQVDDPEEIDRRRDAVRASWPPDEADRRRRGILPNDDRQISEPRAEGRVIRMRDVRAGVDPRSW